VGERVVDFIVAVVVAVAISLATSNYKLLDGTETGFGRLMRPL